MVPLNKIGVLGTLRMTGDVALQPFWESLYGSAQIKPQNVQGSHHDPVSEACVWIVSLNSAYVLKEKQNFSSYVKSWIFLIKLRFSPYTIFSIVHEKLDISKKYQLARKPWYRFDFPKKWSTALVKLSFPSSSHRIGHGNKQCVCVGGGGPLSSLLLLMVYSLLPPSLIYSISKHSFKATTASVLC